MAGRNSPPSPSDRAFRAQDLDLLKTLLVVAMVGAHVVQLITFRPKPEAAIFADYANIVSFSGFMFAFGIGLGLPKPSGRTRSLLHRLRPVGLLLLAVYASSFGFALLVERKPLTPELILDVTTMRRLFGWSEFLASFFVLALVQVFARDGLLRIGRNPWLLVGVSALCLSSTFYVTGAIVPLLPTLVSHSGFANFPLLPYLPWFFVGIWYGSHRVRAWHFLPALAATGWIAWGLYQTGALPQRFPPSIAYILGPAAILLAYLALSRFISARIRLPDLLLTPGRHVLGFLVLSNLGFFATRYFIGKPVRNTLTDVLVTLGILVVLSLGWSVWERLRGAPLSRAASRPAR
jgi:hypothetical protein